MRPPLRLIVLMVLLTMVAGALGGWLGVTYGERQTVPADDLHAVLHHDLDLTATQNEEIAALEQRFATRRKTFEAEMRAANRDLAVALESDHTFGPKEQAAIDRFHRAEMGLQQTTVRHVLAMRAVLDTAQIKVFDRAVYKALTAGSS